MYTSLAFSNFRSIDLLKIENLSTINLFFGKTNCGKTTVLESIFLLSGMNNPDLFRRCNIFRSYKHIKDFRFFFETIPPMVKEVLQDKKETVVIDALKQIDDRIKDFVLFEDEVMVDVGLEKRIPINILGDGVRKFFTLILAIYRSKNGILLIDEIDNGLHFSTMEKLWRILLNVATIFNVQLFITTHNIDSLKGLKNVLASDNSLKNLVSAYKILRKEKIHETLYYSADSFSTVIQQENEIR